MWPLIYTREEVEACRSLGIIYRHLHSDMNQPRFHCPLPPFDAVLRQIMRWVTYVISSVTCLHSLMHIIHLTCSSDLSINLATPRLFSNLKCKRLLRAASGNYSLLHSVPTVGWTITSWLFWVKVFSPTSSGSHGELFDQDFGPTCCVSNVAQVPVLCSLQCLLVSNSLFCSVSE